MTEEEIDIRLNEIHEEIDEREERTEEINEEMDNLQYLLEEEESHIVSLEAEGDTLTDELMQLKGMI